MPKRKNPEEDITASPEPATLPTRNSHNELVFRDFPTFRPNLTPKQVLQLGSFGGTYFRAIKSGVTGERYENVCQEFPADWFTGLDEHQYASPKYDINANRYKISCGGDLDMWEKSGWICRIDPYGWFQWYCRFYLGRRCSDDDRQVKRGLNVFGPTGRWRRNLVNKCFAVMTGDDVHNVVDDPTVSPKVRQLLQHWGYKLTTTDLNLALKKIKK
jgi:hypothetical protein